MHTAGLSSNVDELHQCIHAMGEEIRILKEQLRLALRRQFGSQSEAFSPEKLSLLALSDVEVIVTETTEKPESKPSTTPRATRQAVLVSKDTPVERVELDVADKTCDCCGGTLHRIGEDCSYQVAFIPAQTKVIETARPKYGCRDCETGVKQQPLPPALIPKSMATASLLAYLIVSKYVDHLPLNRLEGILKRYGVTLPRSTQCEWLMRCAQLLKPLTQRMREDLLKSPQVFTDDTILPLQNDLQTRDQLIKARLWVYATQRKTGPPIILYDFTRTRKKSGPHTFLKDYRGYIQADAYSGYDGLYANGAQEVACMAHCRRYFFEASENELTPGPAHQALSLIGELYRVERSIKHYSHKKRKKQRRLRAKPVLKRLHRWLQVQGMKHLPKGKFAKAVNYALNHWPALTRYCDAGYLEIDNNYSEREMKPVALGRKNYLFTGSERGGEAAAVFYSLVETAKANQLNIYAYLNDVLDRLPRTQENALDALLPYHWQPAE